MTIEKIDLYKEFNLEKPADRLGFLTVYMHTPNDRESENRIRPVMLVLGGGGYQYVSPREQEPVAMKYYAQGYNAFVLDYSCPCPYPVDLIEGCLAMAYIRMNAKKYQVDVNHVAAIGFSAGGHLCGTIATLYNQPEVKKVLGENYKLCRPDAVVLSYPVISSSDIGQSDTINTFSDNNPRYRALASLENQVSADTPPAFIWSTFNDTAVPVENSIVMAAAYKKAGVPFELHIFEHGDHGLSIATEEVGSVNTHVAQWVELSLKWLVTRGFVLSEPTEGEVQAIS
ncbi:MAG: alpha/beta hydrolase [Clostridia bacterium]|nr:alpha/beta hydrolase [Clostridia bacterium]